ncbi:SpoIIE family protein phosphatase [Streptomyces hyaluromycini]|uniref:SpoIIE family protein phosphatase n=1 Tax=Streptomyces hyaluromycini TaxID=1377993 RepID=UPI000B5C9FFD|nr:SpoIIE family protein phosphatase [Streptomyces hyaluromycini]
MAGDLVSGGVRSSVVSSWQHCQALGLRPEGIDVPYRDVDTLDTDGDLMRAARPVLDRVTDLISGTPVGVIVTDAAGWILQRCVGEPQMAVHCDSTAGFPGFCLAEPLAGTNAINLVLTGRHACHLFGPEHFDERLQGADCHAVPVRDPLNGRLVGVVNAAYPSTGNLGSKADALIRQAALDIEQRMLEQATETERALIKAYMHATGRFPDASVTTDAIGLAALMAIGWSPRDRVVLQQTAASLIAAGRADTVQVPLSGEQTAWLLARPVPGSTPGVVVEVFLEGPLPNHLTVLDPPSPRTVPQPIAGPAAASSRSAQAVPSRRAHRLGMADTPHPARPAAVVVPDRMVPPTARQTAAPPLPGASWPVMIGDPRVGKFALAARRRLELFNTVGEHIGTTLDVARTAEELAQALAPSFADYITVDLYDGVLRGDEPTPAPTLRRTALQGIAEDCPFHPAGTQMHYGPATPQARCLANGRPVLEADLSTAEAWKAHDPTRSKQILERGVHSLIAVPARARGVTMGVACFYRCEQPEPFEDDDVALAGELVARAAVCIDNARRYTREHTMAIAVQHTLLPTGLPRQQAVRVAHYYQPARSGVGGDWFDVIPLSGARVALVIGDVVGHGIHAAVTMGRLRTAVRNFSVFDLDPDELLTRLDDLVDCMDQETSGSDGVIGATCLCAIYDPTTRRATMARAGHLPPALVHPDGTVTFPDLPAGPPLGLGGLPFASVDFDIPEGSQLILYTDGLVEDRAHSIDVGLDRLRHTLANGHRTPQGTCEEIIRNLPTTQPAEDDITVLVAQTHALDPKDIAAWDDLPADPAIVPAIRAAANQQLDAWNLQDGAFTTELILTELLSNAIRHATAPIHVRLIRDLNLICEVSDHSSTAPHPRQAAVTDEGGRGLFLVAQLAHRWGTHFTPSGKTIWAEQPLIPH